MRLLSVLAPSSVKWDNNAGSATFRGLSEGWRCHYCFLLCLLPSLEKAGCEDIRRSRGRGHCFSSHFCTRAEVRVRTGPASTVTGHERILGGHVVSK